VATAGKPEGWGEYSRGLSDATRKAGGVFIWFFVVWTIMKYGVPGISCIARLLWI